MAKQDLVVKLLLDSGAFGTDLREAQRKAENFSNSIKNAGTTAGNLTKEIGLSTGALGKLGGMLTGAGAVVAAVGAFKSIMESSHDTAKIFQGTLSGFTGVLSSLQSSIATFDFSNFNNGILTVAKNAKIAKEAMMDAARSDVAYQFLSTQYRQQLKNYEVQSKDGVTPELTAAVNTLLVNWEEAASSNATQMFNAFIKNVKAKQSNLDFSIKDKDKVLQLMTEAAATMTGGTDKINADKRRWAQVKRDMDNLFYTAKGGQLWEGGVGSDFESMFQNNITATKEQREEAQRQYDALKAQYQDLMFKVEMYKLSSEDLKNQTDILNRAFQVQQEADDAKTQASGWNKSTPKKSTPTEPTPDPDSIADLQKRIADLEKERSRKVVGTEDWTEKTEQIIKLNKQLEREKELLAEIERLYTGAPDPKLKNVASIDWIQDEISHLEQLRSTLTVGTMEWYEASDSIAAYKDELEELLKIQEEHDKKYKKEPLPEIKNVASIGWIEDEINALEQLRSTLTVNTMEWYEVSDSIAAYKDELEELLKIQNAYDAQYDTTVSKVDTMNVALSSTISALNGIGAAFEMSENESIKALSNITDAFSSVAAGIMNFIQIQQAAAAASGTASAAAMPFPYNLAAIASVMTTVLAVFANIKSMTAGKFAEGGIVGGTSYSGDKLFAMVNSGEMILNKRQQNNLGNMLGGGGQVEFHISGDSLVGVLNNKNRKTNLTR